MKSFFSILLIVVSVELALGQAADSVGDDPYPWRPSFVRVGYDLARMGQSIFSPDYFGQGFSAEVDFNTLFFVTEFGYEEQSFPTSDYASSGFFYRVGVDANLIKYDRAKNVITFGLRYAGSTYEHSLTAEKVDEFGQRQVAISEKGQRAQWFEAGLGLKVRVWKQLFTGYDFTLRFGSNLQDDGAMLPFYVPGYGQAFVQGADKRGLVLGFKYSIYWTFKLRDKLVPLRPVKPPKVYDSPLEEENNRGGNSSNFGNRNF